ncbi:hypothetical protein ACLOJK_036835 [Asimina triloba]
MIVRKFYYSNDGFGTVAMTTSSMQARSIVGVGCWRCATLLLTSTDVADLLKERAIDVGGNRRKRAVAEEADDDDNEAGTTASGSGRRRDGGRSKEEAAISPATKETSSSLLVAAGDAAMRPRRIGGQLDVVDMMDNIDWPTECSPSMSLLERRMSSTAAVMAVALSPSTARGCRVREGSLTVAF